MKLDEELIRGRVLYTVRSRGCTCEGDDAEIVHLEIDHHRGKIVASVHHDARCRLLRRLQAPYN